MAKWLDEAKFYLSKYRPVPVEEYLVFDNAVYPTANLNQFYKTARQLSTQTQTQTSTPFQIPTCSRTISPSPAKQLKDPLINSVVSLANETVKAGYGALVFCSSRSGCEREAILLSQVLPRPEFVSENTMELRRDLLNCLRNTPTGLDHILEKTVPVGAAFHRWYNHYVVEGKVTYL